MLQSTNTSPYNFVRSNLSHSRKYDVFIFWGSTPATLMGGINSNLNDTITVGQMKTWLLLLEPTLDMLPDFEIYVAKTGPWNDVECEAQPMDSSQPLASAYVLNPADRSYCCYSNTSRLPASPFTVARRVHTFEAMKFNATANPGLYPWIHNGALAESYQIPGEIQEVVESRDEGQCFLTGTSALANIHWIFPPIWTKELGRWHMDPHPEHLITDFQTSANAAVMCERFARLFHTNVFGIDVDHGCHVVVFDDRFPKLRDELNGKFGRLPLSGEDGEATMRFLREHFRWCLAACFMSDLDRSQFSDPRYVVEVGELMQTGDEEAVKSARRTYKRDWLTAAGKDTWEQLLNHYWKEEKNIDWDDVSGDEDEEEWPQNESDLFVKAELVARSFSDWDYLYDN